MSFGSFLNIGKLGITGAIKQKLLEEHISVKNFDISVWQEIMDVVKDDENLRKIYTGSTNLKDKKAFVVAKEVTVQISDALWNKVLNIVNRHNGTTTQQPIAQSSQSASVLTQTEIKSNLSQRLNLQAEYSNLPFNSNGDIDFSELTLDRLKARFPESDYIIETNTEQGEFIIVKSKKDGKFILSCANTTNFKGEKLQIVNFEHDGVTTSLHYLNGKFSQRSTSNIDGDNCYLGTVENFDENGNLIRKEIWNKDNTSYVAQDYSNGILCRETTFTKTNDFKFDITEEKRILSDKLIQDITKRINACEEGIGFLPKTDDIEKSILDGISSNTVLSVLYDYKEATGRDLIQDIIDDKMGLGYEKQKEILLHITSMRSGVNATPERKPYFEGQSIGYELQFALRHRERGMLRETLDKINKDNVEFVLQKIFKITKNDYFDDFSDDLYPQLVHLLGDDADLYISKISNAMIEHINEKGGYTKDLVEDLKANKGHYNESVIDFTRLLNRCNAGQASSITGKADGKIDINNIQQKGTGDCWLIASILSATNKNQKGLDYINSMLSVDANGNVTVELKGVNKKYVISAEEIEKSNHLASGDPDMRAIEIAVDKYMKEYSYEINNNGEREDFSHADLNGDNETMAYKILFGNGYYDEHPDIQNEDYNYENQVYSLSFSENPNVKATVLGSSKQSEADLIGRHAYAIKKSDEKYIYLINPHNSSETLQVERALLQTKNPRIYYALIDMN